MYKCRHMATVLVVVTALCLPASGNPAKTAYEQGVQAERQSNYDAAFASYKQAYMLAPTNPKYIAAYTRMRFTAGTQHVHNGEALRSTGSLPAAIKEFQRAAEIDGTSSLAQQEIRMTEEMLQRQEQQHSAAKPAPPPSKI